MSEDFDLKVFRAYPQSEPPVGTVDKGPSRKAVVTGVVFLATLLTIAILGNGAVLFLSFARDKDVQAIQADLKSLRLDIAKLDSVLNKAEVDGGNVNLKDYIADDTTHSEQFEDIAHSEKKINETIRTHHKEVEETMERVTNAMKAVTHQPMDANELENVLEDTLRNISNTLMLKINDALNTTQIYASHILNRRFEETNSSFDLVLNALQNISKNVTKCKRNIRRVSSKLDDLLRSEPIMNIVNTTAEIRSILISENDTDRISLIINHTEQNNRDAKENMHVLDTKLFNRTDTLSAEMEGLFTAVARRQVKISDTLNKLSKGRSGASDLVIQIIKDVSNVTSETQRTCFCQEEVTQSMLKYIARISQKLGNFTDC